MNAQDLKALMLHEVFIARRPYAAANLVAQAIRNRDFAGWPTFRPKGGPFRNRVYVRTPNGNLVKIGKVVKHV
jgi:hypothetical protein